MHLLLLTAGEAQQIDRVMEKFAERYLRDNPDSFSTADGPYLLSFALIMLNTDAHNPMADKKLSADDFVGMCQTQVCSAGGLFCWAYGTLAQEKFLIIFLLLACVPRKRTIAI